MQSLLLICLVVCVNSAYAAAGLAAAKRNGIELTLIKGIGLAVTIAGTAIELAAAGIHAGVELPMLIVAFGAVVIGAACDAACGYVFDAITLPCLLGLLTLAALWHTLPAFALGVAVCGGFLALLYAITWGRGLGLGDVKLACCIGGAAGAANGLQALGIAFVLGAVYAVYLLASKRARIGAEVRFAPYLAAGTAIIVLHGALL